MQHVIITGATGFVGKSLIPYLLGQGVKVTAIILPDTINLLTKHANLEIIIGTLDNPQDIRSQLLGKSYDTMYHLAWTGVNTIYKNVQEIQIKNIDYALSMMDLAKDLNCQRVISIGSVSEYAYVDGAVNGQQAPCPSDLYAATKVSVHTYCDLIARQNEIKFNWVLIPSIYGPGREDNNLITYTIKMLLTGQKPSYTKLEQQWDYIFIDDLMRALYLIGIYGKETKTYVAGYGIARPMSEYVKIIRDKINPEAEIGIGEMPYKTGRVDNAIVDITELNKDTGFEPQVAFEDGITQTIEYYKKQLKVEL
ncbi:NAD(P)-dependent oxidoreductase [Alkalibaculum bacchi]|uniref:NAD-dependent epimerase/dehydratase family protein n=1 Tax=Alkalibaculum bacchi TaxID=645887 RepID=UPI0026ECE37C|nr:NAD(P)-dependent oxidoreductase [Alkalibaculum bacchi]